MNATAVVEISKSHPSPHPATTKSNGKSKKAETIPIIRKPGADTRYHLRETAKKLLRDGYTYKQAVDLLRFFLLDTALLNSGRVKITAAKQLGISREHVRLYHERGADLVG